MSGLLMPLLLLLALPSRDEIPVQETRIPLPAEPGCTRDSVIQIKSWEGAVRASREDAREKWPIWIKLIDACGTDIMADTVFVAEEVTKDTNSFTVRSCHGGGEEREGRDDRIYSMRCGTRPYEEIRPLPNSSCIGSQHHEVGRSYSVEGSHRLDIRFYVYNSLTRDTAYFFPELPFEKIPYSRQEGAYRLEISAGEVISGE